MTLGGVLCLTICGIASKFFSEETVESDWFVHGAAFSSMTISFVSFESLVRAAAAGHQLSAYLISAVTASFAGFLIVVGIGSSYVAWQSFNSAIDIDDFWHRKIDQKI